MGLSRMTALSGSCTGTIANHASAWWRPGFAEAPAMAHAEGRRGEKSPNWPAGTERAPDLSAGPDPEKRPKQKEKRAT